MEGAIEVTAYHSLRNSMIPEIYKSNCTKRLIHLISKVSNGWIIFTRRILVFQTHRAEVHYWYTIDGHLEQRVRGEGRGARGEERYAAPAVRTAVTTLRDCERSSSASGSRGRLAGRTLFYEHGKLLPQLLIELYNRGVPPKVIGGRL